MHIPLCNLASPLPDTFPGSPPEAILSTSEGILGNPWGSFGWMLLVPSGQRPGMLLNILHGQDSPHHKESSSLKCQQCQDRETLIYTQEKRVNWFTQETQAPMFLKALLVGAPSWKPPKCPSMGEWMNKLWSPHTTER